MGNGQDLIFALKKAATWGTAVACGAGNGLLLGNYGLSRKQEKNLDGALNQGFSKEASGGAVVAEGTLNVPLRYDGMDMVLALFQGSTGGAPTQQAATAAYLQTFPFTSKLDGLFATMSAYNGVDVEEAPSAKLTSLEIKGEIGKYIEADLGVICDDLVTDSATNTSATMADVTVPETANRIHYSQMVMRMNAQSGAALQGSDAIYPTSFSFKVARKLKGAPFVGGVNTTDEPLNEEIPEIKLSLKFARHNAASKAYFEDWAANGFKKMDIIFTGIVIADTYFRYLKIQLPNLAIADVKKPFGKGPLPSEIEFDVLGCATAPTGMAVTNPYLISVMDQQTTDVLA